MTLSQRVGCKIRFLSRLQKFLNEIFWQNRGREVSYE